MPFRRSDRSVSNAKPVGVNMDFLACRCTINSKCTTCSKSLLLPFFPQSLCMSSILFSTQPLCNL